MLPLSAERKIQEVYRVHMPLISHRDGSTVPTASTTVFYKVLCILALPVEQKSPHVCINPQ